MRAETKKNKRIQTIWSRFKPWSKNLRYKKCQASYDSEAAACALEVPIIVFAKQIL